jgi:hypothetical protein
MTDEVNQGRDEVAEEDGQGQEQEHLLEAVEHPGAGEHHGPDQNHLQDHPPQPAMVCRPALCRLIHCH